MNNRQNRKPVNIEQLQKKATEKTGWSFRPLDAIANSHPKHSARIDRKDQYRIQNLVYCRLPRGGGNYPVRFVSNTANKMAVLIKPGDYLTFTEFRFGHATGRAEREIHVREFQIISNTNSSDRNNWRFEPALGPRVTPTEFLSEHEQYFEELLLERCFHSSSGEDTYV